MNFRKRILSIITIILIFCTVFVSGCVGCNKKVSRIEIIEGSNPYYKIYYNNGATEILPINQSNIAEILYQQYKESHPNTSYEDFLRLFIVDADSLIINETLPSSAKVLVEKLSDSPSGKTSYFSGSAVIYKIESDYTYFITNYHVVCNSSGVVSSLDNIYCAIYGDEESEFLCEYVGGSLTYDLAVLRTSTDTVKSHNEKVKAITFADDYYVGNTAIAIGNPKNNGIAVTKGVVSKDSEYIALEIGGEELTMRLMRIDTAIYNGSSGGGLFNAEGKLIGITSAGNKDDENINYAIPLEVVKSVIENITYYCQSNSSMKNGKVFKYKLKTISSNQTYETIDGYNVIKEEVRVASNYSNYWFTSNFGLYFGDKIISIFIDEVEYFINRDFDIDVALMNVRPNSKVKIKYIEYGKTNQSISSEYTISSSALETLV